MVKKSQEVLTESTQPYLPNFVRQILESKSAKTIAALAALLVAEAGSRPTVEAEDNNQVVVANDTPESEVDLSSLSTKEIEMLLLLIKEDFDSATEELTTTKAQLSSLSNVQEVLTPEYQLKKPVNSTSVTLTFQNAAIGSELVIKKGYGDRGVVARKKLTATSGNISVGNPNVFDRVKYQAYIVDPDGAEAYIGQWETIYGKNMGTHNLTMPETEQAKLAYENPEYETQQQLRATLEAAIQQLEQQIDDSFAQYIETRAEIPLYSRLHVTAGDGWDKLNINYMTQADATEIVVQVQNPSQGHYHTRRFNTNHEGGTFDGFINASLYNITSTGSTITVSMMVNGQLADQVTLRQQNSGVSGGSDWEWGTFEHGLATENPLDSQLEIVATNGAQLTIAGQTSYDNVRVVMDGGGYLSSHNANTSGGSDMFLQNFAFNASQPSGTYKVKMYDNRNGMLLNEVEFHWDAGSKTITPAETGEQVAAYRSPAMAQYVSQMQEQLTDQANIRNLDIGFTSLRKVQQTMFSERSEHFIADSRFDEILANFPLQGHPDAGSILNEGMAVYNETLGTLLQDAAEVAIAAWHGEDQDAAMEAFMRHYDELSNLRKLNEFKIDFGISFPSANEILEDGMRIAQEHIGDLQVIQAKEISMRKRSAYLAGISDPETDQKLSRDAFDYNESVVINAHGEGSLEHLAYLDAWGQQNGDTIEVAIEKHKEYLAIEYGEGSKEYIEATKEYLDEVDTQVLSYQETYTAIQFDLEEQVQARLDARLDAMTLEERAEARGLLRLHEDGLLDEYFRDLFHGTVNEEVDDELGINTQYKIFYLVDNTAVEGAGHAAVVTGSDIEGWHYFSFGLESWEGHPSQWVSTNGNLEVQYFETLNEAKIALDRYTHAVEWNIDLEDSRNAHREATSHMASIGSLSEVRYGFFLNNCDDIASEIITAADIEIDDKLRPNMSYLNFIEQGYSPASWKLLD